MERVFQDKRRWAKQVAFAHATKRAHSKGSVRYHLAYQEVPLAWRTLRSTLRSFEACLVDTEAEWDRTLQTFMKHQGSIKLAFRLYSLLTPMPVGESRRHVAASSQPGMNVGQLHMLCEDCGILDVAEVAADQQVVDEIFRSAVIVESSIPLRPDPHLEEHQFVAALVLLAQLRCGRSKDAPLFTTYSSLLTTHYSRLTTHDSRLTTHYALLTTYYLLLTTKYSLRTTHYSLLTTYS